MEAFKVSRNIARLIILQRTELTNLFLKKLRKIFGRYIYSNFVSKYCININKIGREYFSLMKSEYRVIESYLSSGQKILSLDLVLVVLKF